MELYEDRGTSSFPPCEACFVELDERNVQAVGIYFLVRNQMRIAPSGMVLGLDYNAVKIVMDIEGIELEDSKDIFDQVLKCFEIERELNE